LYLYGAADLSWLTSSDNTAEGISFTLISRHKKFITRKQLSHSCFTQKTKAWESHFMAASCIILFFRLMVRLSFVGDLGQFVGWMRLHKKHVESC